MSLELPGRTFHLSALIDRRPQPQEGGYQVRVQSLSAQSRDTQSMSGSPSKTSEQQRQNTKDRTTALALACTLAINFQSGPDILCSTT
jgi:hypothetical protein